MGYAPANITASDYSVAQAPTFGGEVDVYISPGEAVRRGVVEITGATTGVFTKDSDPAGTGNLVAALLTPLRGGSSDISVQLGTSSAGKATFKVPGYAKNDARVWQPGFAVDMSDLATSGTFGNLAVSGAHADSKGAKVGIFELPAAGTFKLVGCTTDKGWTTKSRMPVAIACGMNGSAFTKPGRSEPGEINVTAKHVSFADGLARFDGVGCTVMMKSIKEGTLELERTYLMGVRLQVNPSAGDGEDEATDAASGVYEDLAIMPAMVAA